MADQAWHEPTEVELASCKSAASLAKKARAAGWDVDIVIAHGPFIGSNGEPLGEADALSLIFRFTGCPEAWATWYRRKDKWELGSAWLLAPVVSVSGNDIGHWLCGTAPAPPKVKKEAA